MATISHLNRKTIKTRTNIETGEILESTEESLKSSIILKLKKCKYHYTMLISEHSDELYQLITGKTLRAFNILCNRIQDYPSNKVELSKGCRMELSRVLNIAAPSNISKILKELKDKDLLRPLNELEDLWMINPYFVWKGDISVYQDYVDIWNSLLKKNKTPDL